MPVDPGAPYKRASAAAEAAGESARKKSAAETRGKTRHNPPANSTRPQNKGSAAHRASKQGQARADKPYSYGAPDEFPVLNEDTKLRYWLLPASGGQFVLDRVESCTWEDANAILTGSITMREQAVSSGPDPELRIDQGDRVLCEASDKGRPYREVWTMRCYKPQVTMSSGQRTFDLANDLDLLRQSDDNFTYDSDKLHPNGWTLRQVVHDVCARYQIPLGACATTDKPVGRKIRVRRGSPLEVFRWVMYHEHRKFGRRLVLRWDRGKLWILPLQRSPHLLRLGPTLVEAAFQSELMPQFASAISMRGLFQYTFGQDSQGFPVSKRQKMHVAMESPASRKLFGYVHRIVYSPDARTDAHLREEGAAFLAAVAKPHRSLTLTHQGMPFVRRGDAIQLALGDEGLKRQVVYVNAVAHRDQPGAYQSDVTVIFDDPYLPRKRNILFRLKATADEAIGNRARLSNAWWIPKNNKADATSTSPSDPFTALPDPTFGGSIVLNPADGPFTGGG